MSPLKGWCICEATLGRSEGLLGLRDLSQAYIMDLDPRYRGSVYSQDL